MSKENKTVVNGGVGFMGLLQIVFIVLKLCGVIGWSWWLVLLPLIIEFGLVALLILGLIVFYIVVAVHEHNKRKRYFRVRHGNDEDDE